MKGLWGPGSAFRDFYDFLESTKRRGVSFLEMLAMELKSEGIFVARMLAFQCGPALTAPGGVARADPSAADTHPLCMSRL